MTRDKLIAAFLLVDFAALNIYALATEGLGALGAYFAEMGPWGWVLTADLFIALGLCMVWMWRDARRRGASSLPHLVLTALTGSLGPLSYLIRRPAAER